MHWGNSLLVAWVDDLIGGISSMLNAIQNLVSNFLYLIWALIATIVNGIENLFRKLAGLDVEGADLVSRIINNGAVKNIFSNLVGFATAMMIFFTIVKILQDHYKEKDGGNPYKIVLRTFKGMLMFAFVGVAVSVGLYATGVVFRGLDAATSSGATSISGQVFKAMAAEANRKTKGQQVDGGELLNRHHNTRWARMSAEGGAANGKYYLVKVKDNATIGGEAELAERYQELCPEYQYGIVNDDGSVSPIAPYLKSLMTANDDNKQLTDRISDLVDDYGYAKKSDLEDMRNDGTFSASAGYYNDILQAITIDIQPTLDFAWSPIDIVDYTYQLEGVGTIPWDINVMAFGSGVNISFIIEKAKYKKTHERTKPLEETAKSFGISANGKLGFQDGKFSASFNLDMFQPEIVTDLIQSILVNSFYTFLMQKGLEILPEMYVAMSVSGIQANFFQMFAPFLFEFIEEIIDESVGHLIPTVREVGESGELEYVLEDGKPVKMVDAFQYIGDSDSGSGRGVWVTVNGKSTTMPITIQRYLYNAESFAQVAEQLTATYNDFIGDLDQAAKTIYNNVKDLSERIGLTNGKIQNSRDWGVYKKLVSEYNTKTLNNLNRLGNLLPIYETAKSKVLTIHDDEAKNIVPANEYLAGEGAYAGKGAVYPEGNYYDLQDEIKSIFVKMVTDYNGSVGTRANNRPFTTYADVITNPAIYKPIIELKFSDRGAAENSVTADYILDLFTNANSKNNNKLVINIYPEQKPGDSDKGFSRQIDWEAYGPKYADEFGVNKGLDADNPVADIWYDHTVSEEDGRPTYGHANTPLLKQTVNEMYYLKKFSDYDYFDEGNSRKKGFGYFFSTSESPFQTKYTGQGKIKNMQGYWGSSGVTVADFRYYQAYDGVAKIDDGYFWGQESTLESSSVSSASVLRTTSMNTAGINASTAQTNAILQDENILDGLFPRTDVSEEKSEFATEFAKNIITFRKLGTTDDGKHSTDKNVLKDWVKQKGTASAPKDSDKFSLSNLTAAEIDDLMATGEGRRHYLMLTADGVSNPDTNNVGYAAYVGRFGYGNTFTVNALYDMGDMNYMIGYIALVSALGVYLNFAFGLIKRAVNMSVLYIMSPISIAFYPFDDGSKFNQQFVSPFYKEAISAFAVIVSLNIFILLLSPVQKAVEGVLGSVSGWIGGWLALVAFTSMLPGIRDTICSVLGASKMESKGLGQMFSDADKALGGDTRRKLAKKATSAIDNIGAALGARSAKRAKARQKNIEELQARVNRGEAGKWDVRRLNSLKKAQQRADNKAAKREQIKEDVDKAIASGDTSGLKGAAKKRYDQLQKEAKRQLAGQGLEGKALDAAMKEKMADSTFQSSVNGVTALKKNALVRNVGSGFRAVKALAGEGTFLGETIKIKKDKMKGDSSSFGGALIRLFSPDVQEERRNKATEKEKKELEQKHKVEKDVFSGVDKHAAEMSAGYKEISKGTGNIVNKIGTKEILKRAKDNKKDAIQMLDSVYAEQYKKQDPNLSHRDALNKARALLLQNCQEGTTLNHDKIYAELLKNSNNLLDTKFGKEFENSTTTKIQELAKKGSAQLKVDIETKLGESSGFVKNISDGLSAALQFDNEADRKRMDDVCEKHRKDGTFGSGEMVNQIVKEFGADINTVNNVLKTRDSDIKNVQAISEEIDYMESAEAAAEHFERAKQLLIGKIGNLVSGEAVERLITVFDNLYDGNLYSINKDSIGAKYYAIEQDQSLSFEQKEQRKKQVYNEMQDMATVVVRDFIDNEGEKVRKYNSSKKFNEEARAKEALGIVSSHQEQWEYGIKVKTDLPVKQTVFMDSYIQESMLKGDPRKGAIVLQEVVHAVQNGDYNTARSYGLDKETVDTFINWKESGNEKYLNQSAGIGELNLAFMGALEHDMGGTTVAGAMSSLTNVLQLAMGKGVQDELKSGVAQAATTEARVNSAVEDILSSLKQTLSSGHWQEAFDSGSIETPDGKIIRNRDEMETAIREIHEQIRVGKKTADQNDVTMFFAAIGKIAEQHPGDYSFGNAVQRIIDLPAYGKQQYDAVDKQNRGNDGIGKITGWIGEGLDKLS